jgi:hypothetical protein
MEHKFILFNTVLHTHTRSLNKNESSTLAVILGVSMNLLTQHWDLACSTQEREQNFFQEILI